MAKPLELVTEVSGKDAERFINDLKRPMSEKNKKLIERAREFRYRIE
jgi:hypothetical protein